MRSKLKAMAVMLGNIHNGGICLSEDECMGIEALLEEIADDICPQDAQDGAA